MALIHGEDLTLIGDGFTTQPDLLIALLRSSLPTIQQFECGLLYDDESGSRADVETIKVATLSKHVFQNPGGESSPSDWTFPIYGSYSSSSDSVIELNNFLQEVKRPVNLAPFLHFTSVQTGPDNQATHAGTYTFRGVVVGRGSGLSKAYAKRAAAEGAMWYFRIHGIPE